MKMRCLGALVALSMVSVGCSSSSSGGTPATDGGVKDTGAPVDTGTPVDTGAPQDTGGGSEASTDAGPTANNTTGTACTDTAADFFKTSKACDPLGLGTGFCDTTLPSPVCEQNSCSIPDPTKITDCDGPSGMGIGICINEGGTTNFCLAPCTFAGDATAPTGCPGKDTCQADGWAPPSGTTALQGVGHCQGTCLTNADCSTGFECQKEYGACVPPANLKTFSKTFGQACNPKDTTTECLCLATSSATTGYCSTVCVVPAAGAADPCATGYMCSALLPTQDTTTTPPTTLFTAQPAGIAGYCVQTCSTDADCTDLSGATGTCNMTTVGAPTGKGVCFH